MNFSKEQEMKEIIQQLEAKRELARLGGTKSHTKRVKNMVPLFMTRMVKPLQVKC